MKKVLAMMILSLAGVFVGCDDSQSNSFLFPDGTIDTSVQREKRIKNVWKINMQELADDWDWFWMQDRECRLTDNHPRAR